MSEQSFTPRKGSGFVLYGFLFFVFIVIMMVVVYNRNFQLTF